MFNNIRLWWKFEGQYYHKYFYYGIENLIKWFKIIWVDKDWDYSSFYKILRFKLINISRELNRARNPYVGIDNDIKYVNICIKLLDNIIDDYYGEYYHNLLDIKYGESNFSFTPCDDGSDCSTLNLTRALVNTPEEEEIYNKEYSDLMKICKIKEEKTRKLLFKIINENVERWWT